MTIRRDVVDYPWMEVSWRAWSYNVRHELDDGKTPAEAVATALKNLKEADGLSADVVKSASEIIG